ncbi:MAG: N-acetylmuramoyl-L-alanine amidase [Clostridia bacterium]|nr:N-acetylmuramoyl-L-alanine amidase [Clostridia bacterium]
MKSISKSRGSDKGKSAVLIVASVIVIISFLAAVRFLSQIVYEHYDDELIVCLDAGHGGSDAGAASTDGKRLEKDDNLALTLKVKDELEKMNVKVVLTREDDTYISLKDRCKRANKAHCDLFVAIHRNSSAKGTGLEAWISKIEKNGERSAAKRMLSSLSDITGLENRGVKRGYRDMSANNYYVNANTNMPSILLEVGFITSENDNRVFDEKTDEMAASIAKTIYDAISE